MKKIVIKNPRYYIIKDFTIDEVRFKIYGLWIKRGKPYFMEAIYRINDHLTGEDIGFFRTVEDAEKKALTFKIKNPYKSEALPLLRNPLGTTFFNKHSISTKRNQSITLWDGNKYHGTKITIDGNRHFFYFRLKGNKFNNIADLDNQRMPTGTGFHSIKDAIDYLQEKVEKNPYKSEAQRRFFHAAEKRGQIPHRIVEEYDKESEGLELPERVNAIKSFKADAKLNKELKSLEKLYRGEPLNYDEMMNISNLSLFVSDDLTMLTPQGLKRIDYIKSILDKSRIMRGVKKHNPKQREYPYDVYTQSITNRDGTIDSVAVVDAYTYQPIKVFKTFKSAINFAKRKGLKIEAYGSDVSL